MKVYCKNNNYHKLELNKAYEVTNYIMDDNGNEYLSLEGFTKIWEWFDIKDFETIHERRINQINILKNKIHNKQQ